jgi:hypothetical protein
MVIGEPSHQLTHGNGRKSLGQFKKLFVSLALSFSPPGGYGFIFAAKPALGRRFHVDTPIVVLSRYVKNALTLSVHIAFDSDRQDWAAHLPA